MTGSEQEDGEITRTDQYIVIASATGHRLRDHRVDWSSIESLLLRNYPVGKSFEGNDAYPPLILMKCLVLQQWFKIDSDPELETQINDRISFKKFLRLSFDDSVPDHSTFSQFRGRFSKDNMRMIDHELLSQFAAKACP